MNVRARSLVGLKRMPYKHEIAGSSPAGPTIRKHCAYTCKEYEDGGPSLVPDRS